MDAFSLVTVTPDNALCLAGQSGGAPMLWLSANIGQTFAMRMAPCDVTAWTFFDKNSFFLGGFDGTAGLVYRAANGGQLYTGSAEIGTTKVASIALSPEYGEDRTLAAGNASGQVFISTDGGATFRQLGQQLPVSAGVGAVSMAFDSDFSQNGNVYAAVDTKTTTTSKERVFRFAVGKSAAWQSIAGGLPADALMKQATATEGGLLYAVNSQALAAADGKGGMLRCINPTLASPSWETIVGGLDDGVALKGLWLCQNQLWSLDTANTALLTLADTLSLPVALTSPEDTVSGVSTDTPLVWQAASGAMEYEWQMSAETSFASLPSGASGTTSSASARPFGLKPATTYHWRVRVTRPFQSPWSAVQSFSTLIGGTGVTPVLTFPAAGAETGLRPVFQWGLSPGRIATSC